MKVRKSLAIAFAVSNAAPAMAADWSGAYVGITGGYGTGHQSQQGGVLVLPSRGGAKPPKSGGMTTSTIVTTCVECGTFTTPSGSELPVLADGNYNLSGGLVGGGVGYNWQSGRFVYGVEGDGSWADVSGDDGCGFSGAAPHACGGGIRSLGTLRGNIGYDLPTGLGTFAGMRAFAAGGLAVANVHAWDAYLGNSGSKTIAGWTVGGGVEALFGQHWSIRLEYLHVDLGDHAVFSALPPNPERVHTTAEVVRIGLSYHFNAAIPAAVTARY